MPKLNSYPKYPRKAVTPKAPASMPDIEHRLIRIEARLVQLMLHVGLDPYNQTYQAENKNDGILVRMQKESV